LRGLATIYCIIDSLETKAFDGVVMEIGGGSTILRVLKTADAMSRRLACRGCTSEEMKETAIMIVNGDVRLEETIDR
jgi:threonine dehydratase